MSNVHLVFNTHGADLTEQEVEEACKYGVGDKGSTWRKGMIGVKETHIRDASWVEQNSAYEWAGEEVIVVTTEPHKWQTATGEKKDSKFFDLFDDDFYGLLRDVTDLISDSNGVERSHNIRDMAGWIIIFEETDE